MSRLDELIAQYCPNGVEYKCLGDIATDIFRGAGIKREDVTADGIPCVRYGEIYTTYGIWFDTCVSHTVIDKVATPKYFEYGDILFAITGESIEDIAKSTAYMGTEKCLAGGDIVVLKHNLDPKFLSYALSTSDARKQKGAGKVKSKVVHSSVPSIQKIRIPVPPLPVQQEIVRVLDTFTRLSNEFENRLKSELLVRKKQCECYQNNLLTFPESVPYVTLETVAEIGTGSSNTNEGLEEGLYPFFVRSQIPLRKNEYEFDETAIITAGDGVGVGKVYHFIEGKYALHQRAYRIHITAPEILPKFFFHYMKATFFSYISKAKFQGSVSSIRRPMLNSYPVPIPPIDVQKSIIQRFDIFESTYHELYNRLDEEITMRQKQYEYYRDKLLTFKQKSHE